MAETSKRVIRCTPQNQKEMAATVKAWPQLHDLVKQLQEQNLFPGLRAMQITLTGSQTYTDGGLAAVRQITAPRPE